MGSERLLTLNWRIQAEGNTGVFWRAPDREGRPSMKGFEVQARDDNKDQVASGQCPRKGLKLGTDQS